MLKRGGGRGDMGNLMGFSNNATKGSDFLSREEQPLDMANQSRKNFLANAAREFEGQNTGLLENSLKEGSNFIQGNNMKFPSANSYMKGDPMNSSFGQGANLNQMIKKSEHQLDSIAPDNVHINLHDNGNRHHKRGDFNLNAKSLMNGEVNGNIQGNMNLMNPLKGNLPNPGNLVNGNLPNPSSLVNGNLPNPGNLLKGNLPNPSSLVNGNLPNPSGLLKGNITNPSSLVNGNLPNPSSLVNGSLPNPSSLVNGNLPNPSSLLNGNIGNPSSLVGGSLNQACSLTGQLNSHNCGNMLSNATNLNFTPNGVKSVINSNQDCCCQIM